MRFIVFIFLAAFCSFSFGCSPETPPFLQDSGKKNILVYSSAALSNAVGELAAAYENESGCGIDILTGGSAHQMRAVQVNKKGDIIFSSVGDVVDRLRESGIVTENYSLGGDRLAYFVSYGNPLKIDGKLHWLTESGIRSVIGSALTSGAGEETHIALQKAGILKDVFENAIGLASDSKQLLRSVADNDADLAVDWMSLKYSPDSKGTQAIPIDSPFFRRVTVKAGLLKFSREKECAAGFLRFAASDRGRQVFYKFGIEK